MVERSVEGPSGALNFIWLCTAEVARRTLSVDICAAWNVRSIPVIKLILSEWIGVGAWWGEFCQRSIAKFGSCSPSDDITFEITLWDDMIRSPEKNRDGPHRSAQKLHHSKCWGVEFVCMAVTFQPGKGERRTAYAFEEISAI